MMSRLAGSPRVLGASRALGSPRALGAVAAVLSLLIDQASKLWLLRVFDLPSRGQVRLAPWLDLVMAWNRGISYSLLWAEGETGRWLLIAGTLMATLLLGVWLWRVRVPLTGLALGLLIGGALGNVIDRIAYGAVADFVFFHVGSFRWYVFNGADCAIVAGVALLLVEAVWPRAGPSVAKTP